MTSDEQDEKRRIYAENQASTTILPPEGAGRWVGRGEAAVAMRRLEELKSQIDLMTIHRVDTEELQRLYDQVHRALTKAFGLPR